MAILLALVTCWIGNASAQGKCYTAVSLEDESNKPLPVESICKLVEENLNQFCSQPPMACDFKVAQNFRSRIQLPEWHPVAMSDEMEFLEGIVRTQWANPYFTTAPESMWKERRPGFAKALSSRTLSISQANLDLYRTNDKVTYYRVDLGDCTQRNKSILFDADQRHWNSPIANAPIEVIPAPKTISALKQGGEPLGHFGFTGEPIRVDGRTYTYLMAGHFDERNFEAGSGNALYLNEGIRVSVAGGTRRYQIRNVCKLVYQGSE